ncbi:MAG: hypothetical protein WA081_23545, partial [Desulfosalsimonadaceae bacterium]
TYFSFQKKLIPRYFAEFQYRFDRRFFDLLYTSIGICRASDTYASRLLTLVKKSGDQIAYYPIIIRLNRIQNLANILEAGHCEHKVIRAKKGTQ